jgi:hypothetical protein
MKYEIKCKGCLTEFVPKRGNQIYHNLKCQQMAGNARDKAIRDEKKAVQKPLNDNYKALKKILGTEKYIIKSRDFLDGAGVNLAFYTAKAVTLDNKPIWIIFTIGIALIEENRFQIYDVTKPNIK